MMPHLALTLLGSFHATLDDREITSFGYAQVKALLAYLAVEADQAHHREVLGELLWPDRPPGVSRSLIRRALTTLRHAIADQAAAPPFLLITRDTLQFNQASDHHLDVATFTALLDAYEQHAHLAGQICITCVAALEQATGLYRGVFLPHLELQVGPGFSAWIQDTRDWLHRRALTALAQLASYYTQQGDWAQVQRIAHRQLALDPWDEGAHRFLMSAYNAQGERAAALAEYERCRRLLLDEFGDTPSAETTALYETIRHDVASPPALLPSTPRTGAALPSPATALIGRARELALLRERLADPDCRLITIVGGSGVGKTHLALAAAQASARGFRDGAVFVPLVAVTDPAHVAPAICRALGVAQEVSRDAETALLAHLRTREVLLLLDNFEHVLDSAPLLAAITARAPTVTLLITAQMPLAVQAEWLIPLDGLAYPDAETTDGLEGFAAVQLFLQRARQVAPDLGRPGNSLPAIAQICRHLGGLPLGIELAANWVRTLSCDEIAAAVQQNLDVLTSTAPDLPVRHRSLQAVLDATWVRLDPDAQRVYRHLAVFRGGFTREAAEQVARATPHDLQALIAASLLRRLVSGRYRMHPFVRQDAAARLSSDPTQYAEVAARHARYFATWLATHEPHMRGSDQPAALAAIDQELANIRVAWQWMLDQQQLSPQMQADREANSSEPGQAVSAPLPSSEREEVLELAIQDEVFRAVGDAGTAAAELLHIGGNLSTVVRRGGETR